MKTDVNPEEIERFLEFLAEAPRRIEAATSGVAGSRLYLRTEAEPWSASDILAHCEQIKELLK